MLDYFKRLKAFQIIAAIVIVGLLYGAINLYTKIQFCCCVHSLCINPPNIFAIMSAYGYTSGSSLPNMPNTHDAVLSTSNPYSC